MKSNKFNGKFFDEKYVETGIIEYYNSPVNPESRFKKIDNKLIFLLRASVFFAFLIFFARSFVLSFFSNEEEAGGSFLTKVIGEDENLPKERGIIFDSKRITLAKNSINYGLFIDPVDFPKDNEVRENILKFLMDILKLPESMKKDILSKLELNQKDKILLKSEIAQDEYLSLAPRVSKIDGVSLELFPKRFYAERSFSHLIGYVGISSEEEVSNNPKLLNKLVGKSGLEKFYQEELSAIYKNEADFPLGEKIEPKNLKLSIDSKLQKSVYGILEKSLKKLKKEKGVVILMDPENGEILSLVSLPDYDNNVFVRGDEKSVAEIEKIFQDKRSPQINRAVTGFYEPGSTFKPFIALIALEDGLINEKTTINDTGVFEIDGQKFFGWQRSGLGKMDVKSAIAMSSNIFFYTIAGGRKEEHGLDGLGFEKITEWMRKFEIDKKTGIDLPFEFPFEEGENVSCYQRLIPSKECKEKIFGRPWYSGDTVQMGIGQGDILITPIRLATIISAIANDGYIVRPHIVKEKLDQSGNTLEKVDARKSEKIAKTENLKIVREGMLQTTQSGTAQIMKNLPFFSGGKTGTAENPHGEPHAWYVGFAPYENPKVVILVLVENGGEGSKIAAPIAYEILKTWWEYHKASL